MLGLRMVNVLQEIFFFVIGYNVVYVIYFIQNASAGTASAIRRIPLRILINSFGKNESDFCKKYSSNTDYLIEENHRHLAI